MLPIKIKYLFVCLFFICSQASAQNADTKVTLQKIAGLVPGLKAGYIPNSETNRQGIQFYTTPATLSEGTQVCIKNNKILTIRWYSQYDIRTTNKLQNLAVVKIIKLFDDKQVFDWFVRSMRKIDVESYKDFFDSEDFGYRITIQYTAKNRHLEVMIKMNETP